MAYKYQHMLDAVKQQYGIQLKYRKLISSKNIGLHWPNGWNSFIMDMFAELASLEKPPKIIQLKEKFGGLRCYCEKHTAEIAAIIDKYSTISTSVCNRCGEPATTKTSGWLMFVCEKHKHQEKEVLAEDTKELWSKLDELHIDFIENLKVK